MGAGREVSEVRWRKGEELQVKMEMFSDYVIT